ncbi:hypothetical protein [Methylomonas sp. AM2-LC]|uniref:hypothetical protein n=1 Tax=Methylomonas sp. AM2-LC TaxID=3153301 RepID=UPI0032647688
MKDGIAAIAKVKCGKNGINKILFDDDDVVSPYLIGAANRLASCEPVRETVVTPFSNADKENCQMLRVRELSPPQYKSTDENSATEIIVDQWFSTDKRFGYQVTQYPCPNADDKNTN